MGKSSIYYEFIFARKGVGHYLAYSIYVGILVIFASEPGRKKHSLQRDKYFREHTRIRYFHWKSLNICAVNDEILKNVINIHRDSQYPLWPVNGEPSNTFGTLELLFPISKKGSFLLRSRKGSFLLSSKKHH